jgi:hypothetical protein
MGVVAEVDMRTTTSIANGRFRNFRRSETLSERGQDVGSCNRVMAKSTLFAARYQRVPKPSVPVEQAGQCI